MEELWKDIPNYENIYQASNLGRIRTHINKTTYTERHGVRHWKQRILKPKITKDGNHRVSLWKNGKEKTMLVHRLVGMAWIPNPNNLATINHKDGNRYNNNINNLEWLSIGDNIRHGFETGLIGSAFKTIVTNKETKEIYEFYSMVKAGNFMGYNHGYISNRRKRNMPMENDKYSWVVISK